MKNHFIFSGAEIARSKGQNVTLYCSDLTNAPDFYTIEWLRCRGCSGKWPVYVIASILSGRLLNVTYSPEFPKYRASILFPMGHLAITDLQYEDSAKYACKSTHFSGTFSTTRLTLHGE